MTDEALAWFEQTLERVKKSGPPPVGLELILGKDWKSMFRTMGRNLAEQRIRVVRAVSTRTAKGAQGKI